MTELEQKAEEYFEDSLTWGCIADFTNHKDMEKCVDDLEKVFIKEVTPLINKVAELKKENAEKEKALKTMANLNADNVVEIDKLKKENAELKAENEKLKCCENCKWHWIDESYCKNVHMKKSTEIDYIRICDNWELDE